MLTLTHDQRGLLDYLAERVHELATAANDTTGFEATQLMAEADEIRAIRTSIVSRFEAAEASLQLQLPLETRSPDLKRAA